MMNKQVVLQRIGLAILDAFCVALALYLAYQIRFEFAVRPEDLAQMLVVLPLFCIVRLILFAILHLYSGILRYTSLPEIKAIFTGVVIGSFILGIANIYIWPMLPPIDGLPDLYLTYIDKHPQRVPWSVFCIEVVFSFTLIAAMRLSRRLTITAQCWAKTRRNAAVRRVLILGAGDTGEATARTISRDLSHAYEVVCFVDDNPMKRGLRIRGCMVKGTCDELVKIIAEEHIDDVLFAVPSMTPDRMRGIIESCQSAHVGFKRVPAVNEIISGRVAVNAIRQVEIEDLLGRETVNLELGKENNYICGATVLVTGAGGSIGSELCRQLCNFGAKTIVLLGKGENSIYDISQELARVCPQVKTVPAIGDVRDRARIRQLMDKWNPDIVFHAAAHKHVPLMELSPDEAIKNNVFGTINVAEEAAAHNASQFIMISTDKAVRPTSVMGASKRVAEMVIFNRIALQPNTKTKFVAVRFGNVLGSRGSVIPLFRAQIVRGGPVTVTHPEMTRYFMTIPEAVSLVIQAGSRKEQRHLYLLDMGKPMKIADLAANVIRLSGFEPGRDIKIKYTGMRPGEKLYEELLTEGENIKATDMGRIFSAEPDQVNPDTLEEHLSKLKQLAEDGDADGIREELTLLVPDFGPDKFDSKTNTGK
ncbi:MAG: nucleoside-diphosphate sugar epimerase/dehydratase [Candidatus Sumerlaeales bacterium]|nr:nucleoside-diphosphate sugar epimerase/dehydratase [Candidatus Sumerlaeales bacterium]